MSEGKIYNNDKSSRTRIIFHKGNLKADVLTISGLPWFKANPAGGQFIPGLYDVDRK
jgi:hypothetical protein